MTEIIIITALICVTVTFIVFICAAIEHSKYKMLIESYYKHMEYLDGDNAYVNREEFEEYEQMVNTRFEKLGDAPMKYSKDCVDDVLSALKDGNLDGAYDIIQKNKKK